MVSGTLLGLGSEAFKLSLAAVGAGEGVRRARLNLVCWGDAITKFLRNVTPTELAKKALKCNVTRLRVHSHVD